MIKINAKTPTPLPAHLTTWVLTGRAAPDQPVSRIVLSDEIFTIGRDNQNRLCLANQTVSGRHAELISLPDGLLVRDLKSTNGTYLNGVRVQGSQLAGAGDIIQFGSSMFHVELSNPSTKPPTEKWEGGDDCAGRLQFHKLFQTPGLVPYFQPIVRLEDLTQVAFEGLARSEFVGLETPQDMFEVAAERNAEIELSCRMREAVLSLSQAFPTPQQIYLNTHPAEINDSRFLDSIFDLRSNFPEHAIVLEIHESSITDLSLLRSIRKTLLAMGVGLSYDDFGAGQARLLELVEVPPDTLKFDMRLIHDLPNANRERRRLVECLVDVTKEMGILALAECVETRAEVEVCRELGFELGQGFCLGHPAPIEHWIIEPDINPNLAD
jgi:EAL domain-containing protein (putative c-di-GMP-specific phosphodiesterase class I)